jgi:predicted dehydrogenase
MAALRGAIVGFGFIGSKGHAPAYAERARGKHDLEIVAVADTCEARRQAAREALPHATIYDSWEALAAGHAGRLDFVDIATPPSEHAQIAHAALDLGLHVLCEKPIATSAEDARSLVSHALKARRVFFPCHNYKHAPVVKAVRDILANDRIGEVQLVTLQTFRHTHAKGVAEWEPHWRRERRYAGGGIAMDHGSHTFYLAFDWMGAYPTSISARMSSSNGANTEDDFACTLAFPGGRTASAHLTWKAGVRKVLYTLHGERGAIRVEDDEVELALHRPVGSNGAVEWGFERQKFASDWMNASHTTWFHPLLDQFAHAIATGEFAGKEARDSVACIELIEAAYTSAGRGCLELPLR